MGSSTIHQGTQEDSGSPVHLLTGRQTSERAVGPEEPANLPQTPLAAAREDMESANLGKYPVMGENSGLPKKKKIQKAVRKKKHVFAHSGESKRNSASAAPSLDDTARG